MYKLHSLLAASLLPLACPAAEVDVYLFGGQSNMQGQGLIDELPPQQKAPPENVAYWNGKDFEPLVPGQTRTSDRPGDFGPEIPFADSISKPEKPACLIKYSANGMPLDPGWNGDTWVGGKPEAGRVNFYPGTTATDAAQGKLYKEMAERFRNGLEAIRKRGDTPVVRGFLWMQGEQDSKEHASAQNYPANLKLLRDRLAADLGIASLPMVFGQVLPHADPLPRFTARDLIRARMADADMNSGKPDAIPLCKMVSTDGFQLRADTVHYDTTGLIKLGQAMAKAIPQLPAPATPAS